MSHFHRNRLLNSILVVLAFLFFVSASKVWGRAFGTQANPIPVNGNFFGPQGILFPPFPSAACLNAAALPTNDSLTALQLAYSPKRGTDPQNFYTGIATSSKTFGFGFGYFGALGNVTTTNGGFVGLGFKSDLSQYGLSYRNKDLTSNNIGEFDLSYLYQSNNLNTYGT